jgi:hypothetical protein
VYAGCRFLVVRGHLVSHCLASSRAVADIAPSPPFQLINVAENFIGCVDVSVYLPSVIVPTG